VARARWTRRTVLRAAAVVVALSVVAVALVARLDSGAPDHGVQGSLSGAKPSPQAIVPGSSIEGGPPTKQTLPTLFTMSSFNVLGYGHTAPGGNRKGFADGRTRMRWQIDLLGAKDVDVVGFQEFQPEQYDEFRTVVGKTWGVYPGTELSRAATHNSIAWRKDTWRLLEKRTIPIPYFDGVRIRMPVLRLENLTTLQQVWFANFHNPANARGNAQRWRDEATRLEVGLANRLRAETGLPVFITGDMNEKDRYFCRMTGGAPMIAADGGSNGPGGCRPPQPIGIDWIFGPVETMFSNYLSDRTPAVRRTTDHPMVTASVLLPPQTEVNSCREDPLPC